MLKKSKSEADYLATSPTRHCEDCSMFREPARCTLVEGHIYRDGSCKFWEPKE